ncbi:hypothetical protein FRB98_008447 [Tulasnella sp. 332]|nr:hypothetical protein FRB98_008447 [Tulasnella sp. 332]
MPGGTQKRKRYEPSDSDPTLKIGSLPPKPTFGEILNAIKEVYKGPFDLKMEPFPTIRMPQSVIRILTEKQVYVRKHRLTFGLSDGPLTRAAPMHRRTGLPVPFIDRSYKQRQQERSEHLSHYIKVEKIELGVIIGIGKDGYSAEWSTKEPAFMFFDDKERTLLIEIGDHTTERKKRISINIPNVETFSIASLDYQQFALFQLYMPPVFLEKIHREELEEWQQDLETPPEWKRVAYFDDKHKRVGRYATRTIRFVFANDEDHLSDFMRLSRFPKLPPLRLSYLQETANLELYSFKKMEALKRLIAAQDISFDIKFQLEALHYNKVLLPDEILEIAPKIRALKKAHGQAFAAAALQHLGVYIKKHSIAEQTGVAATAFDVAVDEYEASVAEDMPKPVEHMIRHITFTPTSVTLEGPLRDVGNRVLRIYPEHIDNFIRVRFTEEGGNRYHFDYMVDNEAFINEHAGGILHHDRYGQEVTAESLRNSLGDFDREDLLYNPAKWGARIGQTLTATEPSVKVSCKEYQWVDDIMSPHGEGKMPYTDGCGTISPALAREIWERERHRRPVNRPQQEINVPKVFQIRMGPAKGVVSVDYRLKGRKILLRKSMKKFGQLNPEEDLIIEVALMFHSPSGMTLNQPMITLLETLGVKSGILHVLLDDALEAIKEALESATATARLLSDYHLGESFGVPSLLNMLDRYGMSTLLASDKMLQEARNYALYHVQRDMKYKANIPVPDAYTLVGIADVHDVLEEGQIYDGDMYNLIDLTRIPEMRPPSFDEPANYDSPVVWQTEEVATVNDIADFFTRFMMADSLGLVSVRHRLIADQVPLGAQDPRCLKLSAQHSIAVDTPKTGMPMHYHDIVRPLGGTPDWQAGENFDPESGDYYQSERAIGILYRAVDLTMIEQSCQAIIPDPAEPTHVTVKRRLKSRVGPSLISFSSTDRRLLSPAKLEWLLNYYCCQLDYIRVIHTLSNDPGHTLSEAEAFIDTIAGKAAQPRRRKELIVRMKSMSADLVREVRNRLVGNAKGVEPTKLWLVNAWNAWNLSQEEKFRAMEGSASFGWTALRCVLEALTTLEDEHDQKLPQEFLTLLDNTLL